jgi:hypothetical protein
MNENELLALLPALDVKTLDNMLEAANLTCNGEAYDLIATEIFKRPEFEEGYFADCYHLFEEWNERFGDAEFDED